MPRTTVALRSRRSPVRGFFFRRALAVVLIGAGAALIGVGAFHRIDGWLAQRNAERLEPPVPSETVSPPEVNVEGPEEDRAPIFDTDTLEAADAESVPLVDTADMADLPSSRPELVPPPVPDNATSLRVVIPRIGMDYAVFEGVSEKALRRGPGHLPGTPCPGLSSAEGNCVLTGHRDSFFRALAHAHEGDLVELRTGSRSRRYRLVRKMVVRPNQTEVLAPTAGARLTLLTCYPFRWIGPAPLRIAWQARPEITTAARDSR